MKTKTIICTRCHQERIVVDGIYLRKLRQDKKLSLREVARRNHISAAYLCDIELGRRMAPIALIEFWEQKG